MMMQAVGLVMEAAMEAATAEGSGSWDLPSAAVGAKAE